MPQHIDRHWRLDGATNFRDLGGYTGHQGRTVRWRRLFRSEHLAALSAADQTRLAQLGLGRSVDFRGVQERAATPYALPGVQQHALSIEPTVVQRMQDLVAEGQRLTGPIAAELMTELYRSMIDQQSHRFAELFELLLDEADDRPLVLHCTAGKDRTGVAAALILLALGVPRDVVEADYLLTNTHYRHAGVPASDTPRDVLEVLWRVQPGFLQASLQTIDDGHGGIERYLGERLGLTPAARQRLRQRYLLPAEGA